MAIKTNLFKGDRVRLTQRYFNRLEILGLLNRKAVCTKTVTKTKIGTIVNDTTHKKCNSIKVLWDGNKGGSNNDYFDVDDLELVEDEEEDVTPIKEIEHV